LKKILHIFFAEGHRWWPSAKTPSKGNGAVTVAFLCRGPGWPSGKALPSAR
jgi:hypothetical protein